MNVVAETATLENRGLDARPYDNPRRRDPTDATMRCSIACVFNASAQCSSRYACIACSSSSFISALPAVANLAGRVGARRTSEGAPSRRESTAPERLPPASFPRAYTSSTQGGDGTTIDRELGSVHGLGYACRPPPLEWAGKQNEAIERAVPTSRAAVWRFAGGAWLGGSQYRAGRRAARHPGRSG